jgi:magnesium-transporting ATPase (P-type)
MYRSSGKEEIMPEENITHSSRNKVAILIDGDNAQANLLPQILVEAGKYGLVTVRRIYDRGEIVEVTGVGYEPKGEFYSSNNSINPAEDKDLSLLLKAGALCNNATLEQESGVWHIIGDPTEGALVVAAAKAGFEKAEAQHC